MAEEKLGEIYVEIKAKSDKLERELSDLKMKVSKDAEKMGNSFSSMFNKVALAGGAIIALKKALDFSVEAKNLARDAAEIESKFNVVFASVRDEANKLADNFAKNFGLATSTTKELLSSTGDLLTGFQFTDKEALTLSERVNALAQDLVSFSNYAGGAKGAGQALTSAMLGETEAAKALGIVIRQDSKEFQSRVETLMKTENRTLAQARALVVLEEAYKQSGKAVGDYARTKDSLANKERSMNELMKETKENLGKDLLPLFNVGVSIISDFTSQTAKANGQLSVFGTIAKTIGSILLGLIAGIKVWGNSLGTLYAITAAIVTGKWNLIPGIISNGLKKIKDDSLDAGRQFKNIWSTTAEDIGTESGKISNAMNNISVGNNTSGSKIIDILKKEAELYEELYYGTDKWYKKSIELIKAQAKELIDSGISKIDAMNWEQKKVKELTDTYDRMKIKLAEIKNSTAIQTPKELIPIENQPNPYYDENSKRLQDLFNQYNYKPDLIFDKVPIFSWADAVITAADMAQGAMNGFFQDMYLKGEWANSMLEKAFVGLANAFIAQVQRMITQWLAFQAIRAIFSFIPGGNTVLSALTSIPGGSHGGEFIGSNQGVKKMASGGSFIVPPGHPNDTYPLLLRSGEKATITPSNKVGEAEKAMFNISKQIGILNANVVDLMIGRQNSGSLDVYVQGEIGNNQIYISNKRGERKYKRNY